MKDYQKKIKELPPLKGHTPRLPSPEEVYLGIDAIDGEEADSLVQAKERELMTLTEFLDYQLEARIAADQPSLPLITPTPLVAQVQTPTANEVPVPPPSDGTESTVTALPFSTYPRPPLGPRPPTAARNSRSRSNSLARRRITGGVDPLAPPPRPGLISMDVLPVRMASRRGGNHGVPRRPPNMQGGNHEVPRPPPSVLGGNHRVPRRPPSVQGGNHEVPRPPPSVQGGNHEVPRPSPLMPSGNHRVPRPPPMQGVNHLIPLPPSNQGRNHGNNSHQFMRKKPSEKETHQQTGEMKPHPPAGNHHRLLHKRAQLTNGWDVVLRTTREEVIQVIGSEQANEIKVNDYDQGEDSKVADNLVQQAAMEETKSHEVFDADHEVARDERSTPSAGVTFKAPSCTPSTDEEEIPEDISKINRSRFV